MKPKEPIVNPESFHTTDMLTRILNKVEALYKVLKEMKLDSSSFSQTVISHSTSIKQLETQLGTILAHLNHWPRGGLPSDTVSNPKSEK